MSKSFEIFVICLIFLLPFELSLGKPLLEFEIGEDIKYSDLPDLSTKHEELHNYLFWEVFGLSDLFVDETEYALRNAIDEMKNIKDANNEMKPHLEKISKILDEIENNDSHYFVFTLTSEINDLINSYTTANIKNPTDVILKVEEILQKQNISRNFGAHMKAYLNFEKLAVIEIQNFLDSLTASEKQQEMLIMQWLENLQKNNDVISRSKSFLVLIEAIELQDDDIIESDESEDDNEVEYVPHIIEINDNTEATMTIELKDNASGESVESGELLQNNDNKEKYIYHVAEINDKTEKILTTDNDSETSNTERT